MEQMERHVHMEGRHLGTYACTYHSPESMLYGKGVGEGRVDCSSLCRLRRCVQGRQGGTDRVIRLRARESKHTSFIPCMDIHVRT